VQHTAEYKGCRPQQDLSNNPTQAVLQECFDGGGLNTQDLPGFRHTNNSARVALKPNNTDCITA
jgi:hypothetical protein